MNSVFKNYPVGPHVHSLVFFALLFELPLQKEKEANDGHINVDTLFPFPSFPCISHAVHL